MSDKNLTNLNNRLDNAINEINSGSSSKLDSTYEKGIKKGKLKVFGLLVPMFLVYGILGIFLLLGIYLIAYPLLPGIVFALNQGKEFKIEYDSLINDDNVKPTLETKKNDDSTASNSGIIVTTSAESTKQRNVPKDDRVIIPAMKADLPIVEGPDQSVLTFGVWRKPTGGIPGEGNFILTCHRLGYGILPAEIMKNSSCYNFDKLNNGDKISVYWKGKEYLYEIYAGERVTPNEVRIEEPTKEHRLTIYTCDPIGVNTHRLVKYAKLLKIA